MPKKKKTRQQKILADKRHTILYSQHTQTNEQSAEKQPEPPRQSYSFSLASLKKHIPSQTMIQTHTNLAHITHDLRKTFIVTGSIVSAQLFLRLALS